MTSQEILNATGGMLAFGMLCVLGFVTYSLTVTLVPADNQNALLMLIGILSANLGTIVNYYFSSTSTAKKQTDVIATLADTAKTAQTTLSATSPGSGASVAPVAGTVVLEPSETVVVKAQDDPVA